MVTFRELPTHATTNSRLCFTFWRVQDHECKFDAWQQSFLHSLKLYRYIKQNSLCKNLSARPLGQRHRGAENHSGWFATRVTPTCLRIYQSGSPKSRILRALESRAPEISRWCMQPKTSKQYIFSHDNHWYHRLSISIFFFVFVLLFVCPFLYLCL